MTPDEHRAKAEELLAEAEKIETPHRPTPETRDRLIAEATLHALLALGEKVEIKERWLDQPYAGPKVTLDEVITQGLRDGLDCSVTYSPVEDPEADRWARFREKGGKIVNADTGEAIAIVDPAQPAEDGGFVASLSIPTPEQEQT